MQSADHENNDPRLKGSTSHEEVGQIEHNNELINDVNEESEEGYDTEEDNVDHNDHEVIPDDPNADILDAPNAEQNVDNNVVAVQTEDEKHCWVCFGCEQDDPTASWTHPCR